LTALNHNTVSRYLKLIQQAIAQYHKRELPFSGGVELGESYFGAHTVRGKLGCGFTRQDEPINILFALERV
jgi:hypothetical protein